MKTINQRILTPFICILIIMPITIFLLFNIAIHFYSRSDAEHELHTTLSNVRTLIQAQELKSDSTISVKKNTVLQNLSAALTASQLSGNIQFFILNNQNKVLYPRDQTDSIMNEEFRNYLDNTPLPLTGEVVTRKVDGTSYFMTSEALERYNGNYDLTLLFVSTGGRAQSLIDSINTMLMLIICFTTLISIFITSHVTRSISKPLVLASGYAKRIGSGEFSQMPLDTNIKEINEFCHSMNDMANKLEVYDSAQKKFLQSASHELRTPLMSIQGYAEGIENNIFPDTTNAASIIRKESIRLNTLVDELLTLSRIENQTYHGSLSPLNLSNLILDYIQRLNGLALKENIQIVSTMQPNVTAVVDDTLMSQVLMNIISNCIRYAETTITVNAYTEDGKSIITIMDDGHGFSEEDLEHGFERFYKGNGGNFGLGLSIAKSAVEYMNGTIDLYNSEKGAAFKITL